MNRARRKELRRWQFVFVMGKYAMPNRFGLSFSSRPRFGRGAVYAIALCGLAAASVAVLPAVIGAAKAESVMPQVFELNHALPGKMQALAQKPAPGKSFRDCSNGCPEMVVVPQGRFTMGAPAGEEPENLPDPYRGHSAPQHLITIRHKFAIGKFDVTRDEYAQFVAVTNRPDSASCITLNASGTFIATNGNWHSPGFPQTGRDPVVCVGWDDAQAYASWLSAKTGHVYRLPTEAEWEYAARAGTTTARYYSDNPAEICRYTNVGDLDYIEQHPGDSGSNLPCHDGYAFTSPVGRFPPNQYGLYDMLGDVMDWTEDCWNINYSRAPTDGAAWLTGDCSRRVVRGGSWDADLRVVRAAMRRGILSSKANTTFGFRVARTL